MTTSCLEVLSLKIKTFFFFFNFQRHLVSSRGHLPIQMPFSGIWAGA